ncbi:MAG: RDD family protein, partial [Chloroflexales bacterium]|nr:RDD family protein [Chloroflexales bacterium]
MDDRYTIDTPENIEFAYAVAGIGSRFLGAIIDTIFLVILQLALGGVIFAILEAASDTAGAFESILFGIWIVLSFIFLWGYYILFEMLWNGQSPGKRAVGLRVMREGGRPITFAASAIRNLIRLIDFLPGFYGVGVLVMFIDRRARRLGDLAAGTIVVKERQAVTLESLATRAEPLNLPPRPAGAPDTPLLPNLQLLTEDDYNLVQSFLRRRSELGPDSRARLGSQLADALRNRLGLPIEGNPELFLEHLVREYRV